MHRRIRGCLLLLLSTLVVAGCVRRGSGGAAAASTAPVTNTYWRLTELGGQAALPGPPSSREPHLRLTGDDSRASGATGCNSFNGRYTLDGERIRLGPLASTRMACLDPSMNRQEQAFLQALGAANRATVSGETLTLYEGDRIVARFVAVAEK